MNPKQDKEMARLLVLAQKGDQIAYQNFLLAASRLLRPYLHRRHPQPELMEEVLQETLISIHRARHTYLPDRPVGPWLYAICDHRLMDFFRARRRSERSRLNQASQEATAPPPRPEDGWIETILSAVRRLPEKQRRAIELIKLSGLSVNEAAARMGMSESAVKVNAFRGYEAIRKKFGVKGK